MRLSSTSRKTSPKDLWWRTSSCSALAEPTSFWSLEPYYSQPPAAQMSAAEADATDSESGPMRCSIQW